MQFKFGKFKAPVGLELLQSDSWTFFNERSLVSDLVPNRDLGVQVGGTIRDGAIAYAAGVFNGVADGGSSTNADFDSDKDVVGRVYRPALQGGRRLGAARAGLRGGRQPGPREDGVRG